MSMSWMIDVEIWLALYPERKTPVGGASESGARRETVAQMPTDLNLALWSLSGQVGRTAMRVGASGSSAKHPCIKRGRVP